MQKNVHQSKTQASSYLLFFFVKGGENSGCRAQKNSCMKKKNFRERILGFTDNKSKTCTRQRVIESISYQKFVKWAPCPFFYEICNSLILFVY